VSASPRDGGRVPGQAVHEEGVAGPKRCRQPPIAAADMDDKAALDAARREDLPGLSYCLRVVARGL